MDPPKRAPARLRRFYQFKAREISREQLRGMTVRSFTSQRHRYSLRALIEESVVSFVPPTLPLSGGPATCPRVLAAFGGGGFHLGARVVAATSNPVVFIVGFCTNNGQGRWSFLLGGLNFGEDNRYMTSRQTGIFSSYGGSTWLRTNLNDVAEYGVTFRFLSTEGSATDMRSFLGQWIRTFDGQISHARLMSLLDYSDQPNWGPQFDTASVFDDNEDDGTLSLRASLIFE